jgi:hypothetical protein
MVLRGGVRALTLSLASHFKSSIGHGLYICHSLLVQVRLCHDAILDANFSKNSLELPPIYVYLQKFNVACIDHKG